MVNHKNITMKHFGDLGAELEKAGIDHEMTTYSGANHAFSVIGGGRYHEGADKKSWKRFFAESSAGAKKS